MAKELDMNLLLNQKPNPNSQIYGRRLIKKIRQSKYYVYKNQNYEYEHNHTIPQI
jgi:hypothetical protein